MQKDHWIQVEMMSYYHQDQNGVTHGRDEVVTNAFQMNLSSHSVNDPNVQSPPPPLKRKKCTPARSAFLFFCTDERPKMKAALPHLTVQEAGKELGRRWSLTGPEVKQEYHTIAMKYAETNGTNYPKDPNAFRSKGRKGVLPFSSDERPKAEAAKSESTSPEPDKNIGHHSASPTLNAKKKCQAVGKGNKKSVPSKDPNEPKKPPTAFRIFCAYQLPKILVLHESMKLSDQAKELRRRWNNLDPWLRNQYKSLEKHKLRNYKNEMNAYIRGNATEDVLGQVVNVSDRASVTAGNSQPYLELVVQDLPTK